MERSSINHEAYEYALKLGQSLNLFAEPLKKYLDIEGLIYFRAILGTNRYLFLCCGSDEINKLHRRYFDDIKFQEIFNREYKNILKTLVLQEKSFTIYPNEFNTASDFGQLCRSYGIFHSLSINFKKSATIESFCFLLQHNIPNYVDFFLEKTTILNQFAEHLQNNYRNLLYSNSHKFALQYCNFPSVCSREQKVKSQLRKSFFDSMAALDPKLEILSRQERECLKFILRGKTAKEISIILNISARTAEAHIRNLKLKQNCQKKSDLIGNLLVEPN